MIIEIDRIFADQQTHLPVSSLGKIESAESIIAACEPEPCGAVAWIYFDGSPETEFSITEVACDKLCMP
ncbi:hypothetical protein LMG27198_30180 [Methylocystis echinoides]|uniref:Uncharacterized protein n=1 Tax=Methylocystis echinoides TaxID=29468 RepID=A0A9W6LT14_9HYPH|nr:hypothetical protein LMG27198_30180 [Methylocystis echinoides]